MSIAVIGGLNRLKRNYENIPKKMGIKVKVYNQTVPDLNKRVNNLNGIILFTGTISHNMVKTMVKVARNNKILIVRSHSSSISGLRRCLSEIQTQFHNNN